MWLLARLAFWAIGFATAPNCNRAGCGHKVPSPAIGVRTRNMNLSMLILINLLQNIFLKASGIGRQFIEEIVSES